MNVGDAGNMNEDLLSASHRRALKDAGDYLIDMSIDNLCASDLPIWSADN